MWCGGVEGAWAAPQTCESGTFFIALALSMAIFNKKYHQARAQESLKQIFPILL